MIGSKTMYTKNNSLRKASLLLSCVLCMSVQPVFAHVPHDDIFSVAISPTYSQDRTIFIIVRKTPFKSTDGGESWVRLVNGLDYKKLPDSLVISSQTKDILYISSPGDGVYKSQDAGASWRKTSCGLTNLQTGKLFMSPFSDKVVVLSGRNGGLYRTDDGAVSWHEIIPENTKVTAVGFLKSETYTIVIGTDRGVLRFLGSDGKTWTERKVGAHDDVVGEITVIAVSPRYGQDRIIHVGTDKGGIFRTIDDGAIFYSISGVGGPRNIRDIQYLPGHNKKEELAVSTWHDGVYITDDGGKSWHKRSRALRKDRQADHPEEMGGGEAEEAVYRPHFDDVRVSDDYRSDNTLFLGSFTGLYKSTNGARSWRKLDTLSRVVTGLAVSPDYKNDSTVVTAGYTGEVYMSLDAACSWNRISRYLKYAERKIRSFINGPDKENVNISGYRLFDVVFSPAYSKDKTIYFTPSWAPKKDLLLFQDSHWKLLKNAPGGVAITCSPDISKDKVVFRAGRNGNIYRSSKYIGAMAFHKIAELKIEDANVPVSLMISPNFSSDKTLYYTHFIAGIYMSDDGGYSWRNITKDAPLSVRSGIQTAISPDFKNDKILLAGTDEGIFITKDAGKSWAKAGEATPVGDGVIEAVAISPDFKNDRTFLVSVRGKGLFKTEDAGNVFRHIGDDAISLSRVNCPSASMPIQFSPSYNTDGTIYGYGSAGGQIYKSSDRGDSWQMIALPKYTSTILDYAYDGSLIMREHIGLFIAELKEKLASFVVTVGKYKRMLWHDKSGSKPRQWRFLQ